jgi:transposase
MFVRTIPKPSGRKFHYVMKSRRDKKRGHSVPQIVSNLSGLPEPVIAVIKAMLRGAKVKVLEAVEQTTLRVKATRYFAPLWIAWHFWLELEMARLSFFSRREYRNFTAMVLARCVEPIKCRSELRTAAWLKKSATHMFLGGSPNQWNRDDFYPLLTKLSGNWDQVEEHLWVRREELPRLYLYDITSTYFEGEGGSFGALGYSRDEKRGNPQVVIALVADQEGLPVAIRILPGNTKDSSTVKTIITSLKEKFGVEKAVAIMDRGMRTEANIEVIKNEGLDYIMALPHQAARKFLLEHNHHLQWDLFDERSLAEWMGEGKRYVLCRNPASADRDRKTVEGMLKRAEKRLDQLAAMAVKGRIKNRDAILARAVKILTQTKTDKYFLYEVEIGRFRYWRTKQVDWADLYAGCYILETTLSETTDKEEIDRAYRQQREIEEVFKSCKDELHLRPNYHKKDANIFGHIYLTFLAHYLKKALELKISKNGGREKGTTFLGKFTDIEVNLIEINGERQHVITEMAGEQTQRARMAGIQIPTGPVQGSLRYLLPKSMQHLL